MDGTLGVYHLSEKSYVNMYVLIFFCNKLMQTGNRYASKLKYACHISEEVDSR